MPLQVHTASCMLVVVDSVEGPDAAHALALALVEAAMQGFLTDLAAELLRFLDPGGDTFLDPPGAPPGTVPPAPAPPPALPRHLDAQTRHRLTVQPQPRGACPALGAVRRCCCLL